MNDSQRRRDEEAANKIVHQVEFVEERSWDEYVYYGALLGIAHCRETEVKKWKEKYQVANGPFLAKIEYLEKLAEREINKAEKLREQLRVAVDALEKAKTALEDAACSGALSGKYKSHAVSAIDEALQKIEAMKGGGDEH